MGFYIIYLNKMRLRSDKKKEKYSQVITIMHDKIVLECLNKPPVIINGVKLSRRKILDYLLS